MFLDFDGSLADIVADPFAARVRPDARAALVKLVDSGARVAIVSGRPVAFLVEALDVDGLLLVGQYGLERADRGEVVVTPEVTRYRSAVAAAAAELDAALPGLLVERKGDIALTVHWRQAPERDTEAIARVDEIASRHNLAQHATRMARELRPPVDSDKGTAVEALLAPGFAAACFAGDDRGDLPAFDALDRLTASGLLGAAVRIAVSSSEAVPELLARADVTVAGPAGLAALLHTLADARAAPPPSGTS